MRSGKSRVIVAVAALLATASLTELGTLRAEYGDVILNRLSDREGVRPVVFPHWFHRIRYQCRVCHGELGFPLEAGGANVTMEAIAAGRYCGACHNGEIAWSAENCDLCHSAVTGTPTGVRGGHETTGPGRL